MTLNAIFGWVCKNSAFILESVGQFSRQVLIAAFSLIEAALRNIGSGLACDIRRVKEALIAKTEAQSEKVRAEAAAEVERQRVQNAKIEAEAAAIRMDAETRRLIAIADANVRLLNTISQISQPADDVIGAFKRLNTQSDPGQTLN